jgi:hypothetical protein
MDDYHSGLGIERTGCCVTKMEHANSNGIGKYIVSFRINMVMGYKSNGRGQGGHSTWSSPPLFMVN